jgi:hypothetical protein
LSAPLGMRPGFHDRLDTLSDNSPDRPTGDGVFEKRCQ